MGGALPPILELHEVGKRFRTTVEIEALAEVSLEVRAGDHVAILGPSGSGKSTLLAILGTLERPTSGRVYFQGHDISQMKDRALAQLRARHIGFIFQSFQLLERQTALENVAEALMYAGCGRHERHHRALEALDRVGLRERKDHYPHQLSGGEGQRVAVARALVNRPALILADEPTGNLDQVAGDVVVDLVLEARPLKSTVVVVTHNEAVAARMGRRIAISAGRLIEDIASAAL